jgi:excisionase family DNA binding protein
MVSMAHNIDGEPHMTIAETVAYMGCTDGWVRALLRDGKLRGKRLGERLWLVSLSSATEARDALTTRASGKKHLAKRPAAKRAKKKSAKRRK